MSEGVAPKQVLSALRRLYNLERLKSLEAPKSLVDRAEQMVEEVRKVIGEDAWPAIEQEYPRFKAQVEKTDAAFRAWEEKCLSCEHGLGNDYAHGGKWCALYTREETVCPAPCPSFRLKVLN